MKVSWSLEDCINLNHFRELDSRLSGDAYTAVWERDRKIFLDARKEQTESTDRAMLLRVWLDARLRAEEQGEKFFCPGAPIVETLRVLRLLMFFCGLFAGSAIAASYFAYTGATPLNVVLFLSLFIVPQLLLIIFISLRRSITRVSRVHGFTETLIKMLFLRLNASLNQLLSGRRGDNRQNWAFIIEQQAGLLRWPLLLTGQIFGIAFNLGLLAVTLLRITTSDLAFGWQTTLNIGPELLHAAVTVVAAPWAWILPAEYGFPSLEQIEGTRIVLKEGIYNLATSDLRAWWPFLVMSLVTYGILPRFLLYAVSAWIWRRTLDKHLLQESYQPIVRRMTTPAVSTQAAPLAGDPFTPPVFPEAKAVDQDALSCREAVVFLPAELDALLSQQSLEKLLPEGWTILEKITVFTDYDRDQEILSRMTSTASAATMLMLIEAWMVPITEQLSFIRDLAAAMAPRKICIIFLGRLDSLGDFRQPSNQECGIWLKKLEPIRGHLEILPPRIQQ